MNMIKLALPYAVGLLQLALALRVLPTLHRGPPIWIAAVAAACSLGALAATVGADRGSPALLRAPRSLPGTPAVVLVTSALWIACAALLMLSMLADARA